MGTYTFRCVLYLAQWLLVTFNDLEVSF